MQQPIPGPVPARPLQRPGPAQAICLIHFCGRPEDSKITPWVPTWIRNLDADVRLDKILDSRSLYAFPPYGEKQPSDYRFLGLSPGEVQPMVCLSESPTTHLAWLLDTRKWQPWGLFFYRQRVYESNGGPVWYVRQEQYDALTDKQKPWAVRLDTDHPKSDWLHEREWRIPLTPEDDVLALSIDADPWSVGVLALSVDTIAGILIGDRDWQPTDPSNPLWQETWRMWRGPTGEFWCRDPHTNRCWRLDPPYSTWQKVTDPG